MAAYFEGKVEVLRKYPSVNWVCTEESTKMKHVGGKWLKPDPKNKMLKKLYR